MSLNLTELKSGEQGVVIKIRGGWGMHNRLESLGIRKGVIITKVSSQMMHGPVIVKVGNTQIAIGYGMAKHVFVEQKGSGP